MDNLNKKIASVAQDVHDNNATSDQFSVSQTPLHTHNGVDSLNINQSNITPGIRASGSITFSQTTQYTLGITFNPTSVWFYGIAIRHNTLFTVSAANATAGATYTNNTQTFTVIDTIAGGTTLTTYGTGSPAASGTLTKTAGTGDATITFSSFTAPIGVRAQCVGNAQLGKSFYFQPDTTTSVKIAGPIQNSIESSTTFLIDSTETTQVIRATVDEGHLVDVEYPGVVARATILSFSNRSIIVDVTVAPGWSIIGNYVVT